MWNHKWLFYDITFRTFIFDSVYISTTPVLSSGANLDVYKQNKTPLCMK